jgi:hypothetical protein
MPNYHQNGSGPLDNETKKEDIYVLLFDESLNQQLKKTSWTSKLY